MASTISSINSALVDSRVISALKYMLPALNAFSFRVAVGDAVQDNSVYVPVSTDPTVATKTAGTALTGTGTVAGTQVTMDLFEGAGWDAMEGKIAGQLLANYWADKAAGATYSLAKQVVDTALALVTGANYGNTDGTDKLTCAVADFDQQKLALLWQYAETKIKERKRTLLLNTAYSAAIMGESNLGLIFATAGQNFMSSAVLPKLIGMDTISYGAMPSNSENLAGAVFGRDAIAIAMTPPEPLADVGEGNLVDQRVITEPESGLSVLYKTFYDGGGKLSGEVLLLYGVKKVQNSVVRLVTA
jgi:hypothetical protein